ncbi:HPP family protein [Pseudomonas fontis]|uniref:HPP family protein n=1 Tax=Pseudomonas fontis TaxID=2942633 RepID=A0ABT5NZ33_9PSED|nr:HPP family protein [Pseudomonas fontis]MDD0973998.1 HPP family protein [Pseudomonas fontis]MDD0993364.1 HPP family protein [Pseudomonas fontis]
MSTRGLNHWLDRFIPAALHIPPKEWLRAGFGALLGLLLAGGVCNALFGSAVTLHLMAPLAASAVLLFGVHSGALSQPWPLLGSYACAMLVGLGLHHWIGPGLLVAASALVLVILLMCLLRCLHPPGAALAVSLALADPSLSRLGIEVVEPVLLNALCLLLVAVLYNRLTGVRYPKIVAPRKDLHQTQDRPAAERLGLRANDLDQALEEVGGFVDITRDDLERIIRATERHALQRSLGGITAAQVMSRDVQSAAPDMTQEQAWKLLAGHRLKTLPVLDAQRQLVGIASLSDLVGPAMAQRRFSWRALFGRRRDVRLAQVMSPRVISVQSVQPASELVTLLCDQGLHCLPVLEDGQLVGVITQTDLIAALHRHLVQREELPSDERVPALRPVAVPRRDVA